MKKCQAAAVPRPIGSSCRRRANRAIAIQEPPARCSHQLPLGRVVHHLIADYSACRRRAVLGRVVLERSQTGSRADNQHLRSPFQRIAQFTEELVFGAHGTAVLCRVMGVRLDRARLHVVSVESKYLGVLMVGPDHGMCECHWAVWG